METIEKKLQNHTLKDLRQISKALKDELTFSYSRLNKDGLVKKLATHLQQNAARLNEIIKKVDSVSDKKSIPKKKAEAKKKIPEQKVETAEERLERIYREDALKKQERLSKRNNNLKNKLTELIPAVEEENKKSKTKILGPFIVYMKRLIDSTGKGDQYSHEEKLKEILNYFLNNSKGNEKDFVSKLNRELGSAGLYD